MKAMGDDYLESGRIRQKLRTREDLLTAARRLIEGGETPTVEEVAEASGISRTTAYRYFRTQTELLAAAFPETVTRSLLPSPPPADTADRVHAVTSAIIDVVERTESQQRAMLRLSLGDRHHELPLRKGRAIGWLEEALEPSRETLGVESLRQLAIAIRSVCGIEARVWLSDVAGLDSHDVRALQLWAALALVERAAVEPPPGRSSR